MKKIGIFTSGGDAPGMNAAIRAAVSLPLVGIGGIGPANAEDVIRAGCDGVAVVSAIVSAADPEQAAAHLKTIIRRAQEVS